MTTKKLSTPRYAGIEVPASFNADQLAFAEAIKERLEQHSGDRGHPKDRFVTMRDLERAGLARVDVKNKYATARALAGAGGGVNSLGDVDVQSAQLNLLAALMAASVGEPSELLSSQQIIVLDPDQILIKRYNIDDFIGLRADDDADITGTWTFSDTLSIDSEILFDDEAGEEGDLILHGGEDNPPTWLTPGDLMKVDDTNVTLTLTGTPAASLLRDVYLTLGWTGLLAQARGGTGIGTYAAGDILYANGSGNLTKLSPEDDDDVLTLEAGLPVWKPGAGGAGTSAPEVRGASFSGGLLAIAVPTNKVPINIREDCTITGVVVLTQGGNGNCVLDIWKSSYGAFPPTVADTICASSKPTLTATNKYTDSTLTGWTTALSAGDTLLVNLESSSIFTAVTLFLILTPVGSTPADGYTDERARDVIAAALTDTDTVRWTYDDSLDEISADVDTTELDQFTSALPGIVPLSGGGTANFLRADGTWSSPPGGSGGSPVDWNTYTPSITGTAGSGTTPTPSAAQYLQVGDVVTVSGALIHPSTSSVSEVEISLPVAAVLATQGQLSGAGVFENSNSRTTCVIKSNLSNNKATISIGSPATYGTNGFLYFHFTYQAASTLVGHPADSAYGTYTPTITGGLNVSSVTAHKARWTRLGDIVHVSGSFAPVTTAGAASSSVNITIPVASNFTTTADLNGVMASNNATPSGACGGFVADTSLGLAVGIFKCQTTPFAGDIIGYEFSYEVLP